MAEIDDLDRVNSREDRDYFSYTRDRDNKIARRISGYVSSEPEPFGDFDEIQASYPTISSEVYTYMLGSVSIGTVTVSYTNSSKKDLLSVVYNAV